MFNSMPRPRAQATLCFVIDEAARKILLAMKKRGFGAGKYNGYDDKYWMPFMLQGKKIRATMVFKNKNGENIVDQQQIHEV